MNGPPATRTGIEFGAKAALTFLPWRLRHTGIDASFTRQRSNQARVAVQTVGAKLNCIAPCGDNPVGYALNAYPNAGLAWKTPAYNPGPPNYTDRTRYVDGKIAWRWRRNLEFFIEARNLTNQTQTSSIGASPYADGTPNLQNYYYPGRRITVGLVARTL